MSSNSIYLDFNATSPLSKSVTSWLKSGEFVFANPMSQHSAGKSSRKLINETRSKIYKAYGKDEKETHLIFNSGATESLFSHAYSFAEWTRSQGQELLICYSGIDHPAVVSLREKAFGSHVSFLELSRDNKLRYDHAKNLEEIKKRKVQSPNLVILYHHLWVHNETGQISSLNDLKSFKEISDLYIHVDAVQATGKITQWRDLSVGDIWTFSPHKFGAMKGIGFSFSPKSIPYVALLPGGGQQQGLRGGTENPMSIYSIGLALDDVLLVDVAKNKLSRDELAQFMRDELKGIGDLLEDTTEDLCSNTIYFYLNKLSSDISLAVFDLNGLMISAGSACSSGAARPSAVLLKAGLSEVAKNGLRLSFGLELSDEDLKKIKLSLKQIFTKIRSAGT